VIGMETQRGRGGKQTAGGQSFLSHVCVSLRRRFGARSRRSRGDCCDQGSALVEMALACSVLFAMLFGIIEISLALYTYNYVSEAARAGSRYAIVRGASCSYLTNCGATPAQIQTYVWGLGYPGINSANTTVTTTWLSPSASPPTTWSVCSSGACKLPGNAVKVNVTYSFPLSIPFVPSSTLSLHSTSQMVIAN
jgi:Flp pilus assembly protein TadG